MPAKAAKAKAKSTMKAVMKAKKVASKASAKSRGSSKAVVAAAAKAKGKAKAKETKKVEECHHHHKEGTIAHAFMVNAAYSAIAGVRLEHGGPFGAAVVRDGVIISSAHNMVLKCKDATRHAEMNAISQACQAIGSHDLSDCELFTSCEPCPMCWGAVQWSRLSRVHIGVDRHTAAKYGFDDKVFYDEVDSQSGCYGLRRCGYIADTTTNLAKSKEQATKNMVQIFDGFLLEDVKSLFTDPTINKTLRRRFHSEHGKVLHEAHKEVFVREEGCPETIVPGTKDASKAERKKHEEFMRRAIEIAMQGAKDGSSKEREPFGCVITRNGQVISEAHNTTLLSRDATATAEVNAIRAACKILRTHSLEGCDIYCTCHPDLMSLGAILWARISRAFCGVTQHMAAQSGFEEGIIHFKDLLAGRRVTEVMEGVAKAECEEVFKEWSDRNGIIY